MNVLLVDDSEVMRSVLRKVLQMTQAPIENIFEAEDGIQALRVMQETPVALVFSDINMPQMNGIDMIKEMKKSDDLKELPIVVISTEGGVARLDEVSQLGVSDYIRKPFTPERVRQTLERVWGAWDE